MPFLIQRTIARAVRGTQPWTKRRMQALSAVRWILATDDGRFVSVVIMAKAALVRELAQAAAFGGRDYDEHKARFFETLLTVQLTVMLLD